MMRRAGSLVSLLVVGSAWTLLLAVPMVPEPSIPTKENFDLGRFMGKWYEVAVVSTCPFYMQRKRGDPVILTLNLRHVPSAGNFTMMATSFRNGTCQQNSTDHDLTNTPGQFFHHVARFGADVDSYVVETNYEEYAIMQLVGVEKPAMIKTTTVKLYSRTMNVTAAVLDEYKTLVGQRGMSVDTIIMNQNKGECAPGEQETQRQIFVPKKSAGHVVPPASPAQEVVAGNI